MGRSRPAQPGWTDAGGTRGSLVLVVFFLQQTIQLRGVRRVEQMLAEARVLEQPRHPCKGLEMEAGRILGRHQQKEQMSRVAVQGVEVHTLRAAAEHAEDS